MTKDTPSRALATLGPNPSIALQLAGDQARLAVLKDVIAKGCSDEELEVFALVCQRTHLDPFAKQIYAIKRWDGKTQQEVLTIQTSIDGFRLISQRSREYQGQLGPQWCGADGVWKDVWLSDEPPAAARVGILRKGFREPLWGTAVWKRAAVMQNVYEGRGPNRRKIGTELAPFWQRMPAEMLAITAERNAIRRAFPQDTYGLELATPEEIESEHRQVVDNAATYDRIQREFEGPSEYVDINARSQHVVRSSGEVLDVEPEYRPDDEDETEHAGKRAQLSELLREAKKRGLSGEPPLLGHSDQNPLDAALAYWAQRIENYDLDQQAARQSRAAS